MEAFTAWSIGLNLIWDAEQNYRQLLSQLQISMMVHTEIESWILKKPEEIPAISFSNELNFESQIQANKADYQIRKLMKKLMKSRGRSFTIGQSTDQENILIFVENILTCMWTLNAVDRSKRYFGSLPFFSSFADLYNSRTRSFSTA